MKSFRRSPSALGLLAMLVFFAGSISVEAQTWCQTTDPGVRSARQPNELNVVAFGTSVMWGDGLKPEHTFRVQVANWLGEQTGRPVRLWTWAHSAAVVSGVDTPFDWPPFAADINKSQPTVVEQIGCAAKNAELPPPDLILLEGCINDVGAESIVYPWTKPDTLVKETDADCGMRMQDAMARLHQAFPRAITVVVGYYPLVSEQSPIFGYFLFGGTNRTAKHAEAVLMAKSTNGVQPQRSTALRYDAKTSMSGKEKRGKMANDSKLFYEHSKCSLTAAVAEMEKVTSGQFFFAAMPEILLPPSNEQRVDPAWAYGTSQTHEWKISFHLGPFVFNGDEKWHYRFPECKKAWKQDDPQRFVCETSPAFHPNLRGAATYTAAVEAAIPSDVLADWKQGKVAGPSQTKPAGAPGCSK